MAPTTSTSTSTSGSGPARFSSFITQKGNLKVKVNPLVEVTILDGYTRKPKKETRAIGTLLGHVSEGSILEITDAFVVVHSDSQEKGVLMDQGYHKRMTELRQALNPKESVVGWFSVSADSKHSQLGENTVTVHNFFRQNAKDSSGFKAVPQLNFTSPVYIQCNIGGNEGVGMKCFSTEFVPGSEMNLLQFYEMPIMKSAGSEGKILSLLATAAQDQFVSNGCEYQRESEPLQVENLNNFKRQLSELRDLFGTAKKYVDSVTSGDPNVKPEASVGRGLLKELRSIERTMLEGGDDALQTGSGLGESLSGDVEMDADNSGSGGSLNSSLQSSTIKDAIMVKYLSTLCRTQITLAEKIQSVLAAANSDN